MDAKNFYFMAGLPRSGGTLLSSLLNQNPNIYVSPQSSLPNTLGATYNQYQSMENKDSDQFKNIYNVMEAIIPSYYKDNKEKYIIDRNFSWLDPHPYVILQHHLKNEIKIICPVRDILGILASWNSLCEKDKNNLYDKEILKNYKDRRPMPDRRADHFFSLGGAEGLSGALSHLQRVLYPEFKDNILLVAYDDLTTSPTSVMDNIYTFLGIEKFDHAYSNLSNSHIYTDSWGINNHHKIKESIERTDHDYSKIFSPEIIKKYSGLEFWRDKKNYKY